MYRKSIIVWVSKLKMIDILETTSQTNNRYIMTDHIQEMTDAELFEVLRVVKDELKTREDRKTLELLKSICGGIITNFQITRKSVPNVGDRYSVGDIIINLPLQIPIHDEQTRKYNYEKFTEFLRILNSNNLLPDIIDSDKIEQVCSTCGEEGYLNFDHCIIYYIHYRKFMLPNGGGAVVYSFHNKEICYLKQDDLFSYHYVRDTSPGWITHRNKFVSTKQYGTRIPMTVEICGLKFIISSFDKCRFADWYIDITDKLIS